MHRHDAVVEGGVEKLEILNVTLRCRRFRGYQIQTMLFLTVGCHAFLIDTRC